MDPRTARQYLLVWLVVGLAAGFFLGRASAPVPVASSGPPASSPPAGGAQTTSPPAAGGLHPEPQGLEARLNAAVTEVGWGSVAAFECAQEVCLAAIVSAAALDDAGWQRQRDGLLPLLARRGIPGPGHALSREDDRFTVAATGSAAGALAGSARRVLVLAVVPLAVAQDPAALAQLQTRRQQLLTRLTGSSAQ